MKKNVINLNEAQLKKIVAESVRKVLNEKVLPTYDNVKSFDDGEDTPHIHKGEDMFSEDLLYLADRIDKLTGRQYTVTTDGQSQIIMHRKQESSMSLETLEIITKVTRYLHLDKVFIDGTKVIWGIDKPFERKSRKVQVGDKYFDMNNVPKEWQRKKPRVSHQTWYDEQGDNIYTPTY